MTSFQIKCSDFIIEIKCFHDKIRERCAKYLVNSNKSDIIVAPSDGHIKIAERFMPGDTPEEIEFAAVFCALHEKLIEKNACCMHAAVVSVDGMGYAFAAQSGVGKTTHINLWKKILGSRCTVINGDKPVLTFRDGNVFASGSPWCGKEGYSENFSVPLKGICFLKRAVKPNIVRLSDDDIIDRLFYQLSVPQYDSVLMSKCLETANMLIRCVPFYLLCCDISENAAEIAYREMSK